MVKDILKEVLQEMLVNKKFVENIFEALPVKLSEKLLHQVEDLSSQINEHTEKIRTMQGEHEKLSLKVDKLEHLIIFKLRFYGIKQEHVDSLKGNIQNKIGTIKIVPDVKINSCYRINSNGNRDAVIVIFDSLAQRKGFKYNCNRRTDQK